jgi:hypothetical protein
MVSSAVGTAQSSKKFDFFPQMGQMAPQPQECFAQPMTARAPQHFNSCDGYVEPPPEQAGTFKFDLSQLCNDARMPQ